MLALLIAAAAASAAPGAEPSTDESPAFDVSISYVGDVMAVLDGGLARKARYLDNANLVLDADLERLIAWPGALVHVDLLYNGGGNPNDDAGTLQGVDNIEVSRHRGRLFEAWFQQSFGNGHSLRLGLYDLNSEFYSTESAGSLIAPAFGIGSEIAATGPNGPSIFPSTALAARVDLALGGARYLRFAALNASAGVLGDPGGIDTSFDMGALLIAEAGHRGRRTLAAGAWRYTNRQDDIRELRAPGAPEQEIAQGAYVLFEHPLTGPDAPRATSLFVRAGVSDGETTAFQGGWQAGFLMTEVVKGRPDSLLSFGVNQGVVSPGYRRNQLDLGVPARRSEYQLELTYADRLLPHVTVQPDLQYVVNPSADESIPDAVVGGLRVTVEF